MQTEINKWRVFCKNNQLFHWQGLLIENFMGLLFEASCTNDSFKALFKKIVQKYCKSEFEFLGALLHFGFLVL